MAKMIKSTTPASERGQKNKAARVAALVSLDTLRGKNVGTLNEQERRVLLMVLCQLVGLAGEDGVIG